MSFPGWDSVEGASTWAKAFTYAGWISLFLLGIFEILAHTYTTRKETLVAEQTRATKGSDNAEIQRLRDEVANSKSAVEKATGDASQAREEATEDSLKLEELKRETLPREITPEQRSTFLHTIGDTRGFPPARILSDQAGIGDFLPFGQQLNEMIIASGISSVLDTNTTMIRPGLPDDKKLPAAFSGMALEFSNDKLVPAKRLVAALVAAGIVTPPVPTVVYDTPGKVIAIRITQRIVRPAETK